jgi:hypothetical protein
MDEIAPGNLARVDENCHVACYQIITGARYHNFGNYNRARRDRARQLETALLLVIAILYRVDSEIFKWTHVLAPR